jgi:hypothetical protein
LCWPFLPILIFPHLGEHRLSFVFCVPAATRKLVRRTFCRFSFPWPHFVRRWIQRVSVSRVRFGAHPGSRSVFRPPQLGFAAGFVLLVLISNGASTRSIFPLCFCCPSCPPTPGGIWLAPAHKTFSKSKIWSPRG